MGVKVHYEDNLFFLHSILRTVESGLQLDIDPEYFRDKILEDIFFIDATLMRIYSFLKGNGYLINRTSYLRSLRRNVRSFSDFLTRLTRGELGMTEIVFAYQERLGSALSAHQHILREIDAMLDRLEPDDEAADVVSSEEYGFLLSETTADGSGDEG